MNSIYRIRPKRIIDKVEKSKLVEWDEAEFAQTKKPLLNFDGKFEYLYEYEQKIRVDHFLSSITFTVSRTFWAKAIGLGKVLINKKSICKNYLLREGDLITFDYFDIWFHLKGEILKRKVPYQIIFENNDYMIVHKSSGFLVHRVGFLDYSIVSQIEYDKQQTLYVVHRIDKYTSGLLFIAKTKSSCTVLQKMIKEHSVQKYYLICTKNKLEKSSGLMTQPIGVGIARVHQKHQKVDYINGLHAKTRYRYVGQTRGNYFYLARIFTGRQHQIRVHFQYNGAHILNDELYSYEDYSHIKPMHDFNENNLGLHAFRLRFCCPFEKRIMQFTSYPERNPFYFKKR
ncbi:MAG: hypothetical protein COB02_09850 [Candidatus Cloacimonadota bacterium]|nr:MAG: hypothetical protein COB02_09850 [Candidatus Cloacimonadota bacterium]